MAVKELKVYICQVYDFTTSSNLQITVRPFNFIAIDARFAKAHHSQCIFCSDAPWREDVKLEQLPMPIEKQQDYLLASKMLTQTPYVRDCKLGRSRREYAFVGTLSVVTIENRV